MRLQPGDRIRPYEIVSLLGAGEMGEVYRAQDPRLGRDVAIKVLPAARWRGDGRELFYLAADGKMMAVDVNPGQEFDVGTPMPLFQTAPGAIVGDVSADGKRFLLVTPVGPSASAPFTVVLNWTAGLKK